MALKPGYKLTDVGVIPGDWNIYLIQKLIDEKAILDHIDGNHGELYPRSHEFKSHGVPYIAANTLEDGQVNFSACKFLSKERAAKFQKGIAKNGDVLFAHNATVGPTAILRTKLNYIILSTTVTYYRCNPDKIYNAFLFYILQAPFFIKQYQAVMSQSTRNQVPITAQRKFSVALPPLLKEQTAIANALGDADALIQSLTSLIAKKRQIKQGAMQTLLNPYENGRLKAGWVVKKLMDCLQTTPDYGINAPAVPFSFLLPKYIRITDISENGRYVNDSCVSINHPCAHEYFLQDGELVFARTGASVGKTYLYDKNDGELVFAGFLIRIKPDKVKLIPQYLKYYTQTETYWNWIVVNSMRTGQPGINGKEYSNLPIYLPSNTDEQAHIAAILSDMDTEITALEAKLAKYRHIKQGMMQNLLTGRIRLVQPDSNTGAVA